MGSRNIADPLNVDLRWSGAESTYQLFRAYTSVDIFNPANLDRETGTCNATDALAFQSGVIFYNVIPRP
ncbi:MAG: hypothetical protein LAO51_14340 [Acidobacteriia bacterium]|nr:hypothetical protein [Terriglobia bacterium]